MVNKSRRDFLYNISAAGIGMIGFGAFIESCAEKDIIYSQDIAKAYIDGLLKIIAQVRERELPKIKQAVGYAVQAKLQGKKLYSHLAGRMIEGETDEKRPGHPNIFITGDIHLSSSEDFVLTNDVEAARGLSERMVKIVGITSPSTPSAETPSGALENMGSFRMEDVVDIVIYSHVPPEDGIVSVEGIDIPLFPASGVIHTIIYYSFISEVMEELAKHGIYYT